MPDVIEGDQILEIRSTLRAGQRVLYALFSLVPLLAPYELLIRPGWSGYGNPFFLFAAAISVGAVTVSLFLLWAAVAGLDTRLRLDGRRSSFTYVSRAPILRMPTVRGRLADIAELRLEQHDWSDGEPSWTVVAVTRDGRKLHAGSSFDRENVEEIARRVSAMLGLPAPS